MTLTKFVASLAGGLAITGVAAAQANNDALAQIAELKAEVATLKAQSGDQWLTQQRADEIRSIVRDTLADADTRASLQAAAATSGYDGGFFVSSADGNWKLKINALEQVRFVYNNDSGPVAAPLTGTQNDWGFENRRTQMTFSGNVVDPSWTYIMRFNYGSEMDPYTPTAGTFDLQDAAVTKSFSNGFSVTAGQFKTPFMRESLLNDGTQLTVERSVVDYYFSSGYQQGLALGFAQDAWRVTASWGNGFSAASCPSSFTQATSFQNDAWDSAQESFDIAARLEVKFAGDWAQFAKDTSFRGESHGFLLGAAVGYQNPRGGGQASGADTWFDPAIPTFTANANVIKWTVDATAMFGGANLSAAFVGQNASGVHLYNTGVLYGNIPDQNWYGMVVQGGYFLSEEFEVFGRWEWMSFNNNPVGDGAVQNILTFGANYYFAKNNAKWTLDFGIPLRSNTNNQTFMDTEGAGWVDGNNEQWNIRTQLQVAF